MISNNIEASEERQVNLQLEYISYTAEDILEKKVATVKRRRRNTPFGNINQESQVQEHDNIFIQGLDESVGSFIKNMALANYQRLNSCSTTEQTVISLGMDSILDLSYAFGDGHSTIFTQQQWDELQDRFKLEEKQDAESEGKLSTIIGQYTEKLNALSKQRSSIDKKVKILSSWLKSCNLSQCLNDDEEYFLFAAAHIIKLHQKYSHLFNSIINCSEMDYVLNTWSPIIEKLFYSAPNLRIKWKDAVFTCASEDDQSDLKIDIRIILDRITQRFNVEHDISSGEFSKYDPGQLKYQSDRCKVLIGGKNIINNMMTLGIEPCPVPVLQICGTEIYFLEISLVAPGLYVGNEIACYPITNAWDNFNTLPDLVKAFIKYKNQCVVVSDLLSEQLTIIENKKGSTSGSKHQQSSLPTINGKTEELDVPRQSK